jgi:anti-sigma B factor antagonist
MRSEVRVTSDTTVVTLHGDLDMVTVDPLRDLLDRAAAGETPRIVVDLADVPFIDVVSLSAILATADSVRENSRQLMVSGASARCSTPTTCSPRRCRCRGCHPAPTSEPARRRHPGAGWSE